MKHFLRNVEKTALYGHNGCFAPCKNSTFSQHSFGNSGLSCTGIYSTTVKKDELGDLKLSNEKELDIVAFMKTQTDGFLTE